MQVTTKELKRILYKANLKWFTHYLKWEPWRYVVSFTDNPKFEFAMLQEQIAHFGKSREVLAVGGRLSPEGVLYVDVSTAVDDLDTAVRYGRRFRQRAIRDSLRKRVISRDER